MRITIKHELHELIRISRITPNRQLVPVMWIFR
jgi:hypothetical protein